MHKFASKGRPRSYMRLYFAYFGRAIANSWRLRRATQQLDDPTISSRPQVGGRYHTLISLKEHILELIPQVLARAEGAGWQSLRQVPVKQQKVETLLPTVVASHLPKRVDLFDFQRGWCSCRDTKTGKRCGNKTNIRCEGCDTWLCFTPSHNCFAQHHRQCCRTPKVPGQAAAAAPSQSPPPSPQPPQQPPHGQSPPPQSPPPPQPPPPQPPQPQPQAQPQPQPQPQPQLPQQPAAAGPQCRNCSSLAHANPHQGDGQVSFVEEGHSYTDHATGQHPERSCTRVLASGFEPVDFAALAAQYYPVWLREYNKGTTSHKYYGILHGVLAAGGSDAEAQAAVCAAWQAKGDEACRLGTLLHLHCEYDLNNEVRHAYYLLLTTHYLLLTTVY